MCVDRETCLLRSFGRGKARGAGRHQARRGRSRPPGCVALLPPLVPCADAPTPREAPRPQPLAPPRAPRGRRLDRVTARRELDCVPLRATDTGACPTRPFRSTAGCATIGARRAAPRISPPTPFGRGDGGEAATPPPGAARPIQSRRAKFAPPSPRGLRRGPWPRMRPCHAPEKGSGERAVTGRESPAAPASLHGPALPTHRTSLFSDNPML